MSVREYVADTPSHSLIRMQDRASPLRIFDTVWRCDLRDFPAFCYFGQRVREKSRFR
jgi:hypothetical protein